MSLDHEILGRMQGMESKDGRTIQYRGIKYAEIPGRWRDPVMLSKPLSSSGSEYDATKHGPSCPQHPGAFAFDLSLIGNVNLDLEEKEQSEFECLNLVVTVPVGTNEGDNLPVFVWIHGGGFAYGANSWPQYDIASFVGTSVDIEQPVIGVSINYRLGFFGFLASDELGVSGNVGFKDATCAFRWIKKHISGFGGDSNRLTAVGESAGSIMIHTLLVASEKDLFEQAILMSGDVTLRGTRKMEWQNSQYDENVKFLALSNVSASERRKAFYEMTAEDLIKKLPMGQHWCPTVDGSYIKENVSMGELADPTNVVGRPDWCKRIMVGDTADDGTVLKGRIMDNRTIMTKLKDALSETITPAESKRLLDAYSLNGSPTPEQKFKGLLNLSSDIRFYFATLQVQKGWKGKNDRECLRYHFHQRNTIEGQFKGFACHELDVFYLLQNLPQGVAESHKRLGKEMATAWIKFTYGKKLGSEGGKGVMVIGPDDKISFESPGDYDEKYRKGRGKLLDEIGSEGEKCFKLGEMLQGVHGERMQRAHKVQTNL